MKPNRFATFIKAIGEKEGLLKYLNDKGTSIDPNFFINDRYLNYSLVVDRYQNPNTAQFEYCDAINLIFIILIPTETYTVSSKKPRYVGKKISVNYQLTEVAKYFNQENLLNVLSV